ncbi:hypothetical protein, partial [Salmonella sp. s51228]|uniref:hypothetical protein n=1 Tax=Salmonella sp. s51228 TaxID=3159652 RepID=UPI0039815114
EECEIRCEGTEQQIINAIKAETTTTTTTKNIDTKPPHTAPPVAAPVPTTTTTTSTNTNTTQLANDNNSVDNSDNASPVKILTQYEQICKEMNIITRVNKSSVV